MAEPRVALVTGASRGIGLATAEALIGRGWRVGLLARGAAAVEAAARRLGPAALPLAADAADPAAAGEAVARLAERFGAPEVLVNNAAVIDPIGRLEDIDPGAWIGTLAVNVGGPMIMARAVLPGMLARGRGVIVNLSSGSATRAVEGWSAYCASKAALRMFTESLALEYGARGIRVHDFVPGVVNTDMLNEATRKFDNIVARYSEARRIPPELPARCIVWLIEEGAAHDLAVHQSIRDPALRALVGLEERDEW